MNILSAAKKDHEVLIQIWEASVRASHDFLKESDIATLKPLILEQYFDAVDLVIAKDENDQIHGFCGVHEGNIEMLFLLPESIGKGLGKLLVDNAIKNQGATKVDVNEQNPKALAFYEHLGFSVTGRSPLDGQGNPYPLLHLELNNLTKSQQKDDEMENSENETPVKKSNMGYAIALGGGIGLVFGQFLFDNAGIGLAVGAGLGIALGSLSKGK